MASRTAYSTWTSQKPTLFDGHYLRNRSTLDMDVLGYIGIVQHKEHSPEVLSIPPGTLCIQCVLLATEPGISLILLTPMIYNIFVVGLSAGGSSAVPIYTQTIHRTTQNKRYIEQHNNLGECGPCPVLASYTLAFVLQLRKNAQKNLSQGSRV